MSKGLPTSRESENILLFCRSLFDLFRFHSVWVDPKMCLTFQFTYVYHTTTFDRDDVGQRADIENGSAVRPFRSQELIRQQPLRCNDNQVFHYFSVKDGDIAFKVNQNEIGLNASLLANVAGKWFSLLLPPAYVVRRKVMFSLCPPFGLFATHSEFTALLVLTWNFQVGS